MPQPAVGCALGLSLFVPTTELRDVTGLLAIRADFIRSPLGVGTCDRSRILDDQRRVRELRSQSVDLVVNLSLTHVRAPKNLLRRK